MEKERRDVTMFAKALSGCDMRICCWREAGVQGEQLGIDADKQQSDGGGCGGRRGGMLGRPKMMYVH